MVIPEQLLRFQLKIMIQSFTGSSRSEILRLYRDILRATRLFTWNHTNGEPWSRIIRMNARKEFEQAKGERDPTMIARLLYVGRQSFDQTMEKFLAKSKSIQDDISRTRTP